MTRKTNFPLSDPENGAGEDETILLLSPWPESLFAWNTLWPRLADAAQLVAIDLPGFGQSGRLTGGWIDAHSIARSGG